MRSLKPGQLIDQSAISAAIGLPDDISVGDGWKVGITRSGRVTLLQMERRIAHNGISTEPKVSFPYTYRVKQAKNLTGEIAAAIFAAGEVGADLVVVNIVRRHLGLPEVDQEPPRVPGPTAYCAVLCPYCEGYCECEEVDIGVGHQQVTPYVCGNCGAEQMGPYDAEADAEELLNRWWKGWAHRDLKRKGPSEKEQPRAETTFDEEL